MAMTDEQIRARVSGVLRQNLPVGSPDIMNLFGDLVADRSKNCADHFLTIHHLASRGGSPQELDSAVNVLVESHAARTEWPIVLTLHGICTTGKWQKDLTPIISRAHMIPEPLDYGYFLPTRLVKWWNRDQIIDRFLFKYTEIRRLHPHADVSICAHSFGTYVVGYAMLKYKQINFDKIILCGSILPRDFPWNEFLQNGRVRRVLNEYGGKDKWARRAKRAVIDAGDSGFLGFNIPAHAGFYQRQYVRYQHSDFFHPLQFEQSWLPFLQGEEPSADGVIYSPPANKSFYFTVVILLIAIAVAFWIGVKVWFSIHQKFFR